MTAPQTDVHHHHVATELIDALAAATGQILMGTDYPLAQEIGIKSTLTGLERYAGFHGMDRRAIESANALRLFPRLAEVEAA